MKDPLRHESTTPAHESPPGIHAKCIAISKRVRWDIDRDVFRGRDFDYTRKFLPDGLSKVDLAAYLSEGERRLLSQIQGRTYANMFCLVERFIGAKAIDIGAGYALGDQTAFEAMVRLTDEELKHQEMFRLMERMAAERMPAGYRFLPDANEVAAFILGKSNWAVLALTLDIELFTQEHYRSSIDPDVELSELWKDIFLFHWKEESQHALLDEVEWRREHERLDADARNRGVDELIDMVGALDGILKAQAQAQADVTYFLRCTGRSLTPHEEGSLHDLVVRAYRWQYILSGTQSPRFAEVFNSMVTPVQLERFGAVLAPFLAQSR